MSKIYASSVLVIAANEVGYIEKASESQLDDPTANPGAGNWTKYARDLWAAAPHFYQGNKNGYDWCAVFVDWCLYKAAGNDAEAAQKALCYTGPYGAGCKSSVTYYKEAGRFHLRDGYTPKPGDQVFFGASASTVHHTGLVESVNGTTVTTIEGNSGNAVKRRIYAINSDQIYGYGKPRYDGDKPPVSSPDVATDKEIADAVRALFALLKKGGG